MFPPGEVAGSYVFRSDLVGYGGEDDRGGSGAFSDQLAAAGDEQRGGVGAGASLALDHRTSFDSEGYTVDNRDTAAQNVDFVLGPGRVLGDVVGDDKLVFNRIDDVIVVAGREEEAESAEQECEKMKLHVFYFFG